MRKQLTQLLSLYGFWIVMFMIQKPLFMLFNHIDGATLGDWISVITHGFKLDFCFAAYFVFIPVLMFIVNTFVSYNIKKFLLIYNIILGVAITIIFAVDCVLYSYWSFRIDATLIFYLNDFNESLNSVTFKDVIKFLLAAVPYFLIFLLTYKYMSNRLFNSKTQSVQNYTILQKTLATAVLLICLPVLVICTRGGVSTATANIGMVYYCDNQKLNLAAVNPAFNLMYSLSKNENFAKKYQFYDEIFVKSEFDKLMSCDTTASTSFLTTERPNIVVIILESFSGRLVGASNGRIATYEGKEVTPNLNNIAKESIVFEKAYSNGMRTDRGIVSILSGFLAQPDMTIIKYPEKTASLPSMAKTLSNAGYDCEMIYGGDVNFANMRSYFYGSSYKNVTDYKVFPAKDRLSKWGVDDGKMFEYLKEKICNKKSDKPFFTTLLTLSSHEPFDVDFHKFKDKYVNSVAYTDSCLGSFLTNLKNSDLWQNTLVILVADHASTLPEGLNREDVNLYHIPMIFTGGVITKAQHITRLVNQTDIPKTVFTAMNLPCNDFTYSRDVLNPTYQNYAYFVYTNGFGFITPQGTTIWDNDAEKVLFGADKDREMKGKVLLQTLYKDISQR